MTLRPRRTRTLASEVSRSFRAMLAGMTVIIVGLGATTFWLSEVSQPKVDRLSEVLHVVEEAHVAMIDVETSLLAYLSVREDRFLDPYISARPVIEESMTTLETTALDQRLTRKAVLFQVAQSDWYDGWAVDAFALAFEGPTPDDLTEALQRGKVLFDDYRAKEADLSTSLRAELEATERRERLVLNAMLAVLVIVATMTTVATVRRRSRLRRDVVAPVELLHEAVDAVAAGDLRPPAEVGGPAEVRTLRDGLARMARALSESKAAAHDRQVRTDRMAARLLEVVEFARTVSSTLDVSDVLSVVGRTVQGASEARAVRIWLTEAGVDGVHLVHDTSVGPTDPLPVKERRLGDGLVGRSAQLGRVLHADRKSPGDLMSAAFPLVIGARIAGVVEVVDARCGDDQLEEVCQHVESLVGHAAAVIEAARLYQRSTELATRDGLTGLANRRRFDEDLAREAELALRHARRLSFVMLDLDHFKVVNDTYGHQRGDQVLREVATVLSTEARSSDGVYRYGGEEFAVLVSEAAADEAAALAERMRAAVEAHFRRSSGEQTLSCGVASMPEHATTAEGLVAAADAALYAAKGAGRNVVVVATPATGAGAQTEVVSSPPPSAPSSRSSVRAPGA